MSHQREELPLGQQGQPRRRHVPLHLVWPTTQCIASRDHGGHGPRWASESSVWPLGTSLYLHLFLLCRMVFSYKKQELPWKKHMQQKQPCGWIFRGRKSKWLGENQSWRSLGKHPEVGLLWCLILRLNLQCACFISTGQTQLCMSVSLFVNLGSSEIACENITRRDWQIGLQSNCISLASVGKPSQPFGLSHQPLCKHGSHSLRREFSLLVLTGCIRAFTEAMRGPMRLWTSKTLSPTGWVITASSQKGKKSWL